MAQKNREEYLQEICDLKKRAADLERELETYDKVYKWIYDALPKDHYCRDGITRAVQRAMSDAYLRWKEDEQL